MKIKKALASFLILTILAIISIGAVSAEVRDPGAGRSISYTDSTETTIVE